MWCVHIRESGRWRRWECDGYRRPPSAEAGGLRKGNMNILFDGRIIAEVEDVDSVELTTIFGFPAIVVRGGQIVRVKESCEVDGGGLGNLDIPEAEDDRGIILFPEGRPVHE